MQVVFWWSLTTGGSWLLRQMLSRSTIGTRYQTEKGCQQCRKDCQGQLKMDEDARLRELRKIKVLLIQVALRQGIDVENLEEVLQ